jgi:hypothetical protein
MHSKEQTIDTMVYALLKEVAIGYATSLYGGHELSDEEVVTILNVVGKNWPHNKQAMRESVLTGPYPVPDIPDVASDKQGP